jgi:YjjG family noncanonical pyrimidine nucleotidase
MSVVLLVSSRLRLEPTLGPIYTTLLFDLDHTLLDSDTSEDLAFEAALRGAGVEDPARHRADYDRINRAMWAAVEEGTLTPNHVRTARFEQLLAATGLDVDPAVLAEEFVAGLGRYGDLYPSAREVLDALAERASLALVTNGLSEVQRTRIGRLDLGQYFDAVVISAEVGVAKPAPGIFDLAFAALGEPVKETTLMVGDSLTSDIRGGVDYGIATCWYNPHGRSAGGAGPIDHEISHLDQLLDLTRPGPAGATRRPRPRHGS